MNTFAIILLLAINPISWFLIGFILFKLFPFMLDWRKTTRPSREVIEKSSRKILKG